MGQRGWGVVVVALALLATLIVPGMQGRRLGGQAVRGPEPLVGDCVIATSPGLDLAAEKVERPTAKLVACSVPNAGRVVSRFAPVEIPDRGPRALFDSVSTRCQGAAQAILERWQGGPYKFRWAGGEINMSPTINFLAVPLTPGQQATQRGERWLVCAAASMRIDGTIVPNPMPTDSPDPQTLICGTGELSALIKSGDIDTATSISCDRPHRWQMIGQSTSSTYDTNLAAPNLLSMCTDYVRKASAMPDPTAGGALVIETLSTIPGDTKCLITPRDDRTLSASLLGLGARPVPWT